MVASLKDILIIVVGGSTLIGVLTYGQLRLYSALGIIDVKHKTISQSVALTDEISELERLANQPKLVAPILYDNPDRKEQIFYDFVRQYGKLMSISISEKEVGYRDQIKDIFGSFTSAFKRDSNMDIGERILNGAGLGVWLLSHPIHYPILGGQSEYVSFDGNTIEICAPEYKGLKNLDNRPHGYMHAYHIIAAEDLKRRGLLHIDGFNDVGLMEPFHYVPNHEELKNFEKKLLNAIIRKEVIYYKPQTPITN